MPLTIAELPLDQILTDETRRAPAPRLVESLKRYGLFHPIHARRLEGGQHELIDGSRRLAAARRLGWETIAALVEPEGVDRPPKDLEAIVLNTQRQNLQQLYVARHARRLVSQEAHTQAELARELHLSKSTLTHMLRILDCEDLVAAMEQEGLEFGAAKALAALSPEQRATFLTELRESLERTGKFPSVRQFEEQVRGLQGKAALPPVTLAMLSALAGELERRRFPVEIQARHGMQTRLRVVFTVAEADDETVQTLLTHLAADGTGETPTSDR